MTKELFIIIFLLNLHRKYVFFFQADLGAPFYLEEQLFGIVSYAPGCKSKLPVVVSSMKSGASFAIQTLTGSSGM